MSIAHFLTEEKSRLAALEALKILDTEAEREFDGLVKIAALVCDMPISLIGLVADDRQWFKAQCGLPGILETSREVSFCAHAIQRDGLLEIPDATLDSRFLSNPLVTGESNYRFYAGAPLTLKDGSRIGTLCVLDRKPRQLDDRQRTILLQLAELAVCALENRQQAAASIMGDAKFRALSDSAPLGVFATDPAGDCIYTNSAWQDIYGMSAEESFGNGWVKAIHPEDRDLVAAEWKRTAEGRLPFDVEFRLLNAGEALRCIRAVAKPVIEASGQVTGFIGSVEDVTEQMTSKAALEDERQRLASIIAGTSAGTWEWNVETGQTRFNEFWASILGYSLDDLGPISVQSWLKLGHPDDIARSNELLQRHFSGELPYYECEVRMRHRAGHWVWVLARGRVLTWTGAGLPQWMYGTHIDITSRKSSEEALRKSEELLGQIGKLAGIGVWELDVASGGLFWSAETCRIHGLEPGHRPRIEEAINFYAPEARPVIQAAVESGIETGKEWDLELPFLPANGGRKWVRAVGRAEHDATGRLRLFGAFQDITDRIVQQKALEMAHYRVSLATESAGIGIWELDLSSQNFGWDSQMFRLYGLPETGPAPDYTAWLSLVHAGDRSGSARAVQEALSNVRPFDTEFRVVWPDGSIHHLKATARVVLDAQGLPARMVGVNWDLTERVAQAVELDTARRRAEEALDVKGRFLAMMSHELRTPLNAVIGFSNLLIERQEARTADGERYLRNIETASKTLLGIVNDVMIVSKSQAGAIELDPQPFRLSDTIDDTAIMLRQQAEAKGLEFKIVYDPMIPDRLLGDDSRLKQVLLNLMSNAVKFTKQGKVVVYVMLLRSGGRTADIRFVISDTGIGVSEDGRRKLFQRFSQVDQTISRQFGGSGLGLSICKDLLELMGSTIDVESKEGQGSRFTFDLSLPVVDTAMTAVPSAPKTVEPTRPLDILVAEDVAMNQELLHSILTQRGHKVTIVSDGAAAVEALMPRNFDIVLMDIHMPTMDGMEATRRIRALGGDAASVPIIALTANVLSSDVARFLDAGMNAHVGKPFAARELFAAIERWSRSSADDAGALPKAGAAGTGEPVFDAATLQEMRDLIGGAKTLSLLEMLTAQTGRSFETETDKGLLAQQAHSLASSSGMLGFTRLSKACRALEAATRSAPETAVAFDLALLHAVSAKHQSLKAMQNLLLDLDAA